MKLTETQKKVLADIRQNIINAKSNDFYRFVGIACNCDFWNAQTKYPGLDENELEHRTMVEKKCLDNLLTKEEQVNFWQKVYNRERTER